LFGLTAGLEGLLHPVPWYESYAPHRAVIAEPSILDFAAIPRDSGDFLPGHIADRQHRARRRAHQLV